MYIIDDGIRLNAKLEMPQKPGRCPIVIIIHGFTGHMEERHIIAVSKLFNDLGLATLRVDMYGHGKSDGEFRNHTLFKWMTNAMTIIDYARELDFVTDIYLCGHSQGGLTVMLAAALKHDQIKAIIPLSPATSIIHDAEVGNVFGTTFNPKQIPDEISTPDWTLDGNYFRVAQTIDIERAIDSFDKNVLIVHGDMDESVPVRFAIEAAKRYRHAQLALIKGETHCYDLHLDQVLSSIRNWMVRQLDSYDNSALSRQNQDP